MKKQIWNAVDEAQPTKSGEYRVKTNDPSFSIKYAYYDLMQDIWSYDDGTWLPICVDSYITHWAELNNR